MPDLPETWAKRIQREVRDAWKLRSSAPLLFVACIVIGVITAGFWGFGNYNDAQALKDQIRDKQTDIIRLEAQLGRLDAQLAPFRTIALERFPGEKEGNALAALGTQINALQAQFDNALAKIHTFALKVEYDISADWVKGKAPGEAPGLKIGGLLSSRANMGLIVLELSDGKELKMSFNDVIDDRIVDKNGSTYRFEIVLTTPSGSPIFGIGKNEIIAVKEFNFPTYGISQNNVSADHLTLGNLHITFHINGESYASAQLSNEPAKIEIAPGSKGYLGIGWQGRLEIKVAKAGP